MARTPTTSQPRCRRGCRPATEPALLDGCPQPITERPDRFIGLKDFVDVLDRRHGVRASSITSKLTAASWPTFHSRSRGRLLLDKAVDRRDDVVDQASAARQ